MQAAVRASISTPVWAVVAAAVHREGTKNTDDATVLVVQDVRGRAG